MTRLDKNDIEPLPFARFSLDWLQGANGSVDARTIPSFRVPHYRVRCNRVLGFAFAVDIVSGHEG